MMPHVVREFLQISKEPVRGRGPRQMAPRRRVFCVQNPEDPVDCVRAGASKERREKSRHESRDKRSGQWHP